MESIDKYLPEHPILKPLIASIIFWRRSATNERTEIFLPNNVCGTGITLSGNLLVKYDGVFIEMPVFGTRNTLDAVSEIKTTGDFFNISIRLVIPKGLCLFTRLSMDEVYKDQYFSMEAIFGNNAVIEITEKMQAASDDKSRQRILESFLVDNIVNQLPEKFSSIIQCVHNSKGLVSINYLAKQFSLSERTINRYFNQYVGINPNHYINLIRFRSVIKLFDQGKIDFHKSPLDLGYYDQSHFIKHFKSFSHLTPSQFFQLKQQQGLSDFYNI
jgi:AraC-like DNA-binding protein